MGIYDKLMDIREELSSKNDNVDALKEGLKIKLDRIEYNYNRTIEDNCNYILSRSNVKVFKALQRFNNRKEKEGNEEESNWGFIESI